MFKSSCYRWIALIKITSLLANSFKNKYLLCRLALFPIPSVHGKVVLHCLFLLPCCAVWWAHQLQQYMLSLINSSVWPNKKPKKKKKAFHYLKSRCVCGAKHWQHEIRISVDEMAALLCCIVPWSTPWSDMPFSCMISIVHGLLWLLQNLILAWLNV